MECTQCKKYKQQEEFKTVNTYYNNRAIVRVCDVCINENKQKFTSLKLKEAFVCLERTVELINELLVAHTDAKV